MFGNRPIHLDGTWTLRALGLLRIVTGLLFLQHGTGKILGFPHSSMAFPPAWSLYWAAGWLELVGSVLLIIGLFTRPVAFLLAGEMAIAYWAFHAPESIFPIINRGETAILFCFIFLLFAATGPGAWSIDEILAKRRSDVEGYNAPGGERTFYNEEDE